MRHFTHFLCLLLSLSCGAFAADRPQSWLVQFPAPAAGLVDLHVLVADGKPVSGFAMETDRGPHWDADVSSLKVADGVRLEGEVKLTQQPDITAANAGKPTTTGTSVLTFTVAAKDGRIQGTVAKAAGDKSIVGLLARVTAPVAVAGRVVEASAADAMIELMPLGVSSAGKVAKGLPDVHGGDCVVLRLQLAGGKVAKSWLVLCPDSGNGPKTVIEGAVPAELAVVSGQRLAGNFDLAVEGFRGRLTLDGTIIGSHAAGTAQWEATGDPAARTTFRAWVSRAKIYAPPIAEERTWPAPKDALPADAALAAQAAKESLMPIRPGEPGKQPFYSTRLVHLRNFKAIYAPAIAFAEVPGVLKYRITARPGVYNSGQVVAGKKAPAGWSFEAGKPWAPLTPIWAQVPAGPVTVSAVGLDAAGKDLGPAELPETVYHYAGGNPLDENHWKLRARVVKQDGRKYAAVRDVPLQKMSPFAGPYWRHQRSEKEAALAAARCGRDNMLRMKVARGLCGLGNFNSGDGGYGGSMASFAIDCCNVARWTDDAVERAEALALAERMTWRLYLGHKGGMPTVYKGVIPGMSVHMQAYLDIYALTRDERFKEAALDLGRVLAKAQQPSGGFIHASGGARQAWPGGVFGPAEFRENGAEVALRFFGELRRACGTREFAEAEQKARTWTRVNALPTMMWQNVGHHSMEMTLIQDTVPAFATDYAIWLLDMAEDEQRDIKEAIEVVRWCEERVANWSRDGEMDSARPFCSGWGRAAGSGTKNAGRLAYCFARLFQETKDPLWKAKAEGLLQGLMEAQEPATGFIPPAGERKTSSSGRRPSYDMATAAEALATVPELLAGPANKTSPGNTK
jgi:hypothetical protein